MFFLFLTLKFLLSRNDNTRSITQTIFQCSAAHSYAKIWRSICNYIFMRNTIRKYLLYLTVFAGVAFMSSCATYSNGRGNNGLPPGKAKKIYGTKSAKPFAPGQRKKQGNRGKGNKGNKGKHHNHRSTVYYYQQ